MTPWLHLPQEPRGLGVVVAAVDSAAVVMVDFAANFRKIVAWGTWAWEEMAYHRHRENGGRS